MSTKYNEYLSEHLANVRKAYFWLKDHAIIDLKEFESYFLKQLNTHDLSKYSQEEYYAYDNYFYGAETEKVKKDFDYAWLHHIHNNPHHWQYWVLINDEAEEGTIALRMPRRYVLEMICDWWAFSWSKDNLYEIFDWYEKHKGHMMLHEDTRDLVEEILGEIKTKLDEGAN